MTPQEFIARLEAISDDKGKLYGRLDALSAAQQAYATKVAGYRGSAALAAAWKCFFLETVERVNVEIRPNASGQISEFYPLLVERLVQYFTGLCAAEAVATMGYPLQGYTLLRNVFDSVILTAAAAVGKTDFYRLEGLDPAGQFDATNFRKLRRAEEQAVRPLMTGPESGLSQATLDALKKWDVLFDDETHGGLLSRAHTTSWLRGTEPLPVLPQFNESSYGMFLNRYCEIAWMIHRLIPLLQLRGTPLSDEWKTKWKILDQSFLEVSISLADQAGKPIGRVIVDLVSSKFAFDENSHFWR